MGELADTVKDEAPGAFRALRSWWRRRKERRARAAYLAALARLEKALDEFKLPATPPPPPRRAPPPPRIPLPPPDPS